MREFAFSLASGEVPELADGHGLGPCAARRGGSSPPFPTKGINRQNSCLLTQRCRQTVLAGTYNPDTPQSAGAMLALPLQIQRPVATMLVAR